MDLSRLYFHATKQTNIPLERQNSLLLRRVFENIFLAVSKVWDDLKTGWMAALFNVFRPPFRTFIFTLWNKQTHHSKEKDLPSYEILFLKTQVYFLNRRTASKSVNNRPICDIFGLFQRLNRTFIFLIWIKIKRKCSNFTDFTFHVVFFQFNLKPNETCHRFEWLSKSKIANNSNESTFLND